MNTLQFSASMTLVLAALLPPPVIAQQGPAGVPGALEIIELVAPELATPPPSPSSGEHRKAAPARPPRASDVPSGDTQKAPVLPQSATPTAPATPKKSPKSWQNTVIGDCGTASDPARCRLYQKARQQCQALIGPPHRQCLRGILAPAK